MQAAKTVEELLRQKLRPIQVGRKSVSELLTAMRETGFQGRALGIAAQIWEMAVKAEDTVVMMGYAGSLSTTGQWKIVKWLVENRLVDVLVSTGANISEDLIEAMGFNYWIGTPYIDDDVLRGNGIYRFHDVYVREADYIEMEKMLAEFMMSIDRGQSYSSSRFLNMLGRWLHERGVDGILAAAYRAGVPVFCPAIVDSGYGVAYLMNRYKDRDFKLLIDHFMDYELLVRIRGRHRNSAAIFIGGGVPKDFIQLSAVTVDILESGDPFRTRPHKYAIQITTDSPQWGGLSGATLEEGKSWGKEAPDGYSVQCFCDATIALPLISHYLAERGGRRGSPPDLSWVFSLGLDSG
ncbi:MAG: deoxyhypusine synthase family protein [Nitrososphaerota archaeon]